MFRGSAASSAASSATKVNPEAALNDVLSKLELTSKECTGEVQSGGVEPQINVEEITVLIILFHGTVQLKQIPFVGSYHGQSIAVGNLRSIENLAYLALAPTGLSNIGTNHELTAYRTYIQYKIEESITESIQKIETSADVLVSKHSSQPESQPVKKIKGSDTNDSIFSRICKYCFSLPDQLLSSIQAFGDLFTNYKFNDNFTVCTSVETTSLSGGNGTNLLKGGTKRKRETPKDSLSMSHDMFVLMLNELRLKIKKFDSDRIKELCTTQLQQLKSTTTPPPPGYCETLQETLKHINERCRNLHILKGLDTTNLPFFINKHLSYNSSPTTSIDGKAATVDSDKNMGVIKLQFIINGSGKVECIPIEYHAHEVMKVIAYNKPEDNDGVYWSTMEACIAHCTKDDDRSKTTFVIDLTCSSLLGAKCSLLKESSGYITYPGGGGGGKRIKKKSGSMKKTRRIKNKSKSTRHIRNRRNRLKHNKRTKKGRKTKTYRKH